MVIYTPGLSPEERAEQLRLYRSRHVIAPVVVDGPEGAYWVCATDGVRLDRRRNGYVHDPRVVRELVTEGPTAPVSAVEPEPAYLVAVPGGSVVQRTRLIGTDVVRYDLLDRVDGPIAGYSTITHLDDDPTGITGWYGYRYSEALPPAVDALPAMSDERSAAVRDLRSRRAATIAETIHRAHPHLRALDHDCATRSTSIAACESREPRS